MWVAMGPFYQMIKWHQQISRYCMIEWVEAALVKESKIQAWQEFGYVLAAISKIESRKNA